MESPTYTTGELSQAVSDTLDPQHALDTPAPSSQIGSTTSPSSTPPQFEDSKSPVLATTFGVEFEFLLAFNEDVLRRTLSKYKIDAQIVKSFSDYEHRSVMWAALADELPSHHNRSRYPSWALHVPATDLVHNKHLDSNMFCVKSEYGRQWLRRPVMEPLLVAKERLNNKSLDVNVVGWAGYIQDDPAERDIAYPTKDSTDAAVMLVKAEVDYSKWTLTNDHTLLGALRSQLHEHLESRNVPGNEFLISDSYGLEMVSPILDLRNKKEAFEEIRTYLEALNGTETSTFRSVWASVHVHIGWNLENPEEMPLLTLQHLAYILVLHEEIISKCHPRSRSGIPVPKKMLPEPDDGDLNGYEAFDPDHYVYEPPPAPSEAELEDDNEQAVLAFETEYAGAFPKGENVLSNARYLRKRYASLKPDWKDLAVQNALFLENSTIYHLIAALQVDDGVSGSSRGYMYNFANLVNFAGDRTFWKPIKPTVEFRQHACTLDPVVLEHWVTLLEAIVRKAEGMASEKTPEAMMEREYAEREASKYLAAIDNAPWPYQSMRLFCTEFLGLNEHEGDYWQGRFEMYKDDRPEYVDV